LEGLGCLKNLVADDAPACLSKALFHIAHIHLVCEIALKAASERIHRNSQDRRIFICFL
jgi:hypothetical protein